MEVTENSAALEAGVKVGDVIVKFGKYDVGPFSDLQFAISKHPSAAKPIPMQVIRTVDEVVREPSDPDSNLPTRARIERREKEITLMVKLKREFP